MRVRPLFWVMFAVTCIGVLVFAAIMPEHVPALLHVQIAQQPPTANSQTSVLVHITDPQGLPLDQAQVISSANMTNMDMTVQQDKIQKVGPGDYVVQYHLSMAGPWSINISVQAQGFAPLQQAVFVQVA